MLNNLLLGGGMATVFLGTFYPLFAEVVERRQIVGRPALFRRDLCADRRSRASSRWRSARCWPGVAAILRRALRRLPPALIGALLAPLIVLCSTAALPLAALGGVALAVWAMLGVLADLADQRRLAKLPPGTPCGAGCAICRAAPGAMQSPISGSASDRRGHRLDRMAKRADRDAASRRHAHDRRPQPCTLSGCPKGCRELPRPARRIVVDRPGSAPLTVYPERRWYPIAGSSDDQYLDHHQRLWRSLSGARRPGRQGRLGVARG